MNEVLKLLVHGESKVGKTWLSSTAPKPIVFLDSEAGGMRFTPVSDYLISWNPMVEGPPKFIDDVSDPNYWEACQVNITDPRFMDDAVQWLLKGNHDFKSIVIDSLSKYQQKVIKQETTSTGGWELWHSVLHKISYLIIECMNMVSVQPQLQAFVCITGSTKQSDSMIRKPMLDGKMRDKIAYDFDCIGHLSVVQDDEGMTRRLLQMVASNEVVAGNNLGGLLPDWIYDPNVEEMLETINKNREARKKEKMNA